MADKTHTDLLRCPYCKLVITNPAEEIMGYHGPCLPPPPTDVRDEFDDYEMEEPR